MKRIGIVIAALLASLLAIPATPHEALADASCPTPANSYAGGAGTEASPWQIATKEQFQRLRDDSVTGWDDSYVLTANINMNCTWTSVIGNPSVAPFTGKLDGDGHVVSGLTVSMIGSAPTVYAGLVGYLGAGGIITELGFTGAILANTTNPNVQVFAGGLVGRTLTGSAISYSYASAFVQGTTVGGGSPAVHVGGLVGDVNGGIITNSYATGNVSLLASGGSLYAGGLAGKTAPSPNASVSKSYSTGSVNALGGGSVGGFIGMRGGTDLASDNFWDTTSSGTSTGVGSGSTTGIVGRTTSQLQALATYTNWAMTSGWTPFAAPTSVWGICPNFTRAFLLWQYASTPCPSTPGAPTITGITPAGTTASVAFTVDDTGNSALTRLEFAYDDTVTVDDSTGTVTSPTTARGLTLGTTYTLYMRVVNAQFTGPWSTPQTFTTLRRPGAPTITGVTPSLSSAQVAFTVDDSGGSPLIRLEIALDDTTTVDDSTAVVTSPYTIPNLASGTAYVAYVRAVNAQGAGPWSFSTAFATLTPTPPPPPTPPRPIRPSPPTGVVATAGDGAVFVSWSPPVSSGSFPIDEYRAVAAPGDQTCVSSTTSCTIAGLVNGVTYTVRVESFTQAGASAPSEPSNAVTPQAPTVKSLSITGSRGLGSERRLVTVSGVSTGLAGEEVTMWLSFGGGEPRPGQVTAQIQEDGTFTWSRRSPRAITLYADAGGVRSPAIRIRAL